jgi:hypothetical protein
MDTQLMIRHLVEAAGKKREEIAADNPFKKIGFDNSAARLGWVKPPSFEQVQSALECFLAKAEGKEHFIFVGMGGSVNGVKTLIALSGSRNLHALDSLDPMAVQEVIDAVGDMKKALVIPISKSGTTKESQLLAVTLRDLLGGNYTDNFLWVADPGAHAKLDSQGWQDAEKMTIQVDQGSDIGGRFSSPHTMVFLAPLAILLGRDMDKLRGLWESYTSQVDDLRLRAAREAVKYREAGQVRLVVEVRKVIVEGFANWVIQLLQESLGSKAEHMFIKTLVVEYGAVLSGFTTLAMPDEGEDPYVYVMKYMYFLQAFTALLAYVRDIDFLDQPYVEVYKKELKNLEGKTIEAAPVVDLGGLVDAVRGRLTDEQEFIDCVLFFHADRSFMSQVKQCLSDAFSDRIVSVFIGSDWNHHSYQAAFGDKKTLFVIAPAASYNEQPANVPAVDAQANLSTLKAIAFATYTTISEKAVYAAVASR